MIQRVLVSQLDEPLAIAGVKHQEAGQAAALFAVDPEHSQQTAQLGRQPWEVFEGDEVEILAGADHAGIHLAQFQPTALPCRNEGKGLVDAPEPLQIRIEGVGENGVEQMARDVGAGQVPLAGSRVLPVRGVQGHQQYPLRPQMDGGAERTQLVDGAIPVDAIAYGGGGKDEGQRRRGQQVIRGEQGTQATSSGALPGLMFGPPLEEGGGEAVIVVGGRDGDGLQAAVENVVIDAVIVDELIQQTAQGGVVKQVKGAVALGGDEAGRALIEGAPQQLARVEVEDVVGLETSPDPLQLAHPQMETGGVARQRRDVESPRRGAAQNGEGDADVAGVEFGHRLEYADLIGGAGTTTSQQKSSIGSGHAAVPCCDGVTAEKRRSVIGDALS